ncbi:sensor histidine kinase [Mucilaginibacter sp. P19]|uniref:Histidine kinase n=2 Tax=Mucilaginibacter TaxID=423349 RepID=A0A1G8KFS1_9SPHI|nr:MULTISPECIES: histidine kinase [Mucilaginibacter]QTE35657.1 histidine kinase [Mucilaginibacter gossypii]RAV59539.1 histidine kinase [Mucilaginibacter rubeus]SDI41720.1 Histidine kinase [Mucilaginibacter gossypii]
MDKTEKRICLYSSLLVGLMMNSGKLLALRENGIIARYWHFNLGEWSFQLLYNIVFCFLMFYLNLKEGGTLSVFRNQKKHVMYVLANIIIAVPSIVVGVILQRVLFVYQSVPGGLALGYFTRFALSIILISIVIKIILLLREARMRETENQLLKNARMQAELELLKEQMNPHFLFNSLSSLSGVIGENPALAQQYVKELSAVFRYALIKGKTNLVTLQDELTMLRSFAQLITLRLEDAFKLDINVDSARLNNELPHLSLQPLLENAVKHNAATITKPLTVSIYMEGDLLVISNNLQEVSSPENSNGIGLANLNERFRIMTGREIEIIKTAGRFIVKLPLKV